MIIFSTIIFDWLDLYDKNYIDRNQLEIELINTYCCTNNCLIMLVIVCDYNVLSKIETH